MPFTIATGRCLFKAPAVSAVSSDPFALDGSSVTGNASATSVVLPGLTTTYGNCVCVVAIISNAGSATSVTSASMTFSREPSLTPPTAGATTMDIWYSSTVSSSALSNEVVTVNVGSAAYTTATAFCLSGANTSSPFDQNAAIPDEQSDTNVTATITTTATDVFGFGLSTSNSSIPAAGFTEMNATATGNFCQVCYKLNSGSAFSAVAPFSVGNLVGSVATAIRKAS